MQCSLDSEGCTGGWDYDLDLPGPCSACRRYEAEAMADARRSIGGVEWHAWNDRRIADGGKP
jgi:hypothetical protein